MTLPIGRPILMLAALAVVTGIMVWLRPGGAAAERIVWSFTPADAAADRVLAGAGVGVDLIAAAAVDVRLTSLFMADLQPRRGAGRPDVVELELGSVGKVLRGAAADVAVRPLDGYLHAGGWDRRLVPARLAGCSLGGRAFGVPLDLHPVVLVYRTDLIDLSRATTWPAVQGECLRYRQSHGKLALGLPSASADVLLVMLQQRHAPLVDAADGLHLADPAVVDTVCRYARAAVAVGTEVSPGPGGAAADLAGGNVAALVLADWGVADLARAEPSLAGRVAAVPLPRFDPSDAPTATWGGTVAVVPRFCPDPDGAWRTIERLYLAHPADRFRLTGVLPPLPAAWADPAFHQPDPFFAGGQRVTELYMRLAADLPARPPSAYAGTAGNLLAFVLGRAVSCVRSGGDRLESRVAQWLTDRQAQLQRQVDFDRRCGRAS